MGRQVRKVPEDWEHPKDSKGAYIPLFGGSYKEDYKNWMENWSKWQVGLVESYKEGIDWEPVEEGYKNWTYTAYAGGVPSPDDYMPDFDESSLTHLMMYETCTEGTPISPAFKTPEELAHWLADNNASSFGSMTATYEQWLATCELGFAVSAVKDNKGFRSGVEFNNDQVLGAVCGDIL